MSVEERIQEYENVEFDKIIMDIRSGRLRVGKYSHLVKIDKNYRIKGHKLFDDKNKS